MKLAPLLLFFLILFAALAPGQSGDSNSSITGTASSLPPAQRTAVYAPAVATRSAADSLANNADAQAAAQEQDEARVYAQAVIDEQHKRIAVATQQAAFATQIANDVAVSNEYATLTAVSLQATSEAISRTIAYDAEQYHANVALIQATKQAAQAQAFDDMVKTGATDSIGYFWTWLPTIGSILLFGLFLIFLYKLISLIGPHYEDGGNDDPPPAREQAVNPDPVIDLFTGLNFTSADPRTLLINIVTFSGRRLGWSQNRIAGSAEIGSAISGRTWDKAIQWGKDHYGIVTQQGPPANGGGTYVPGDIGSLSMLKTRLTLDPAIDKIPTDSPTP